MGDGDTQVTGTRSGAQHAWPIRPVLVTWLVLAAAACATGMRQPRTDAGMLTIGVTTSGADVSGYRFRVTVQPAGISETVAADAGVFTKSDVPAGEHVVRLLELPARCRVEGGADRRIAISSQRRSAVLRFHVVCD